MLAKVYPIIDVRHQSGTNDVHTDMHMGAQQGVEPFEPAGFLKRWHRHNSDQPINGYDDAGAWRESYWARFSPDTFPIVIDANVLRNCIGPTAKRAQQTVLTSLANRRAARVFCAPHVIEELIEHLDEWAVSYGVSPDDYRAAFERAYLPLLRVVPTDGIEEMLTPDELAGIDSLRSQDADDVPTATVALAMGAMPVTMDPRPWEAIYGAKANTAELQQWLTLLLRVGDLTESEVLMMGARITLGSVLVGGAYSAAALYRFSPVLLIAASVGLAAITQCIPKPTLAKVWSSLKVGFETYNEALAQPNSDAAEQVHARLPPFPQWEALVDETSRDAALGRACLFQLSRSRQTLARASDLAIELPHLTIGQEAMRLGTALRRYPAFFEPYEMRWQVGRPASYGWYGK